MLGTMMNDPLTLDLILERGERVYPKTEVVTRLQDGSLHRTNLGEVARRARRLAAALQQAGLEKGDRVATLCWNHYAHLEAYFGVPLAGGVLHMLNIRLPSDDLAYIANHAGDRFLIVDDVLLPVLETFRHRVAFEKIMVVQVDGENLPDGTEAYEDVLAGAPEEPVPVILDEHEGAAMCYTSGTTGRPKGVVYSHRSVVLHSLGISLANTLSISCHEVVMPVVPMFHVNAWGIPYAAMMTGAKQVFPGPHLDAANLLDLMESEGVTFAAGVPTIWFMVIQELESGKRRYRLRPELRTLVGGAACPESLIRRFDKQGVRVDHGWGMTEMSPVGTTGCLKAGMETLAEDEMFAVRAKQGLLMPFVRARVVNDAGEAPWDGESVGELEVRGPWIAAGYYNNSESGDRWTEDGWFRTGDVVTIDPEGYVKIVDRTKDLIKSGGEWISSVDLENALMGHPDVAEAAVIAVAHPKWTERPLAAIVPVEGASPKEDELRAFLAERFPKWWLPDAFVLVDAIPRTSTGKFKKSELRERFRDWSWT